VGTIAKRSGEGAISQNMIIVVTGANTGIGFGIVQRILDSHFSNGTCPTIIMACRNQIKAQEAKNKLLEDFFPTDGKAPYRRDIGDRKLVLLAVDLGSPESVLKACKEVKATYDHIDLLILNAGIMQIEKIDLMTAVKNLLTRPSYVASTGGDAIVQRKGLINKDGLGECFAANVFGHWIMVRELSHLIERAIDGKVIWFSSTTANPMFFNHNDFQGIKS
jgi:17beta-estradiol 17-dehydrogenase/3beta-hydroxysteroid 3-dehydrogenase